ncbi:MAG TPA: response regulator, partial [Lachnospiraceae bacterium]|nr:response regulator [Lachnospiraceae bacterium]
LRILKKYLEGHYEVQIENAGYRFVEKMDEYQADLILLDIEMPVLNGLRVFHEFIKNPRNKNIPVVFLSGISEPSVVREVIRHGAAGYFVKTAPKSELLQRVQQVFDDFKDKHCGGEILVLSNDIALLRKIQNDLEASCYKVYPVSSAFQAMELLRKKHIDLMLLGTDVSGAEPEQILAQLSQALAIEQFPALFMEEPYEKEKITEKVGKALGR